MAPKFANNLSIISSTKKFTPNEILNWVNNNLQSDYQRIEDLCTGVAYCLILNLMFPGCTSMKLLKYNAKQDYEYMDNLKVLQTALHRINVEKIIPKSKLVLGHFNDNFLFAKWFVHIFDDGDHVQLKDNRVHLAVRKSSLEVVGDYPGAARNLANLKSKSCGAILMREELKDMSGKDIFKKEIDVVNTNSKENKKYQLKTKQLVPEMISNSSEDSKDDEKYQYEIEEVVSENEVVNVAVKYDEMMNSSSEDINDEGQYQYEIEQFESDDEVGSVSIKTSEEDTNDQQKYEYVIEESEADLVPQ